MYPHAVDYSRRLRHILGMLIAYSAIYGVIACFLPEEDSPLDVIFGIPLLILGISWCYTDAAQRGHRIGRIMKWALVLIFALAFVVYVFQTRGVAGFKTVGWTTLLVFAMVACAVVTETLTLFLGQAFGLWEVSW